MIAFRGQKRLAHAQIGLLWGFNSKFPTSIPTPFGRKHFSQRGNNGTLIINYMFPMTLLTPLNLFSDFQTYILIFTFQECFIAKVHSVYLLKPEGFWENRRTSFGSSKLLFEVKSKVLFIRRLIPGHLSYNHSLLSLSIFYCKVQWNPVNATTVGP